MPRSKLICIVAAFAAFVPAAALAQGGVVELPGNRLNNRPFPADDSASLARSGGLLADWRFRNSRGAALPLAYQSALQFASCVSRFDREAPVTLLAQDFGGLEQKSVLGRMISDHGTCVSEAGVIHPLLLRAAFAEVGLRAARDFPGRPAVGVPAVVDGYPLARVSRCHAALAPNRVQQLLATRPGSAEEHKLADQMYRSLPQCGTREGLGRVEATVARLALVDAVVTSSNAE